MFKPAGLLWMLLLGSGSSFAEPMTSTSSAANILPTSDENASATGQAGDSLLESDGVVWGSDQVRLVFPAFNLVYAYPEESAGVPLGMEGVAPFVVTEGSNYYFKPTVTGPQSSSFVFSAENLPHWARIDEASGELTGIPGPDDLGTYSNIVISVRSGTEAFSMTPFAITVVSNVGNQSIISWKKPISNIDGTQLTDLIGYRVLYGENIDALRNVLEVPGENTLSIEIDDLHAGLWCFAVKAVNSIYVESERSAAICTAFD